MMIDRLSNETNGGLWMVQRKSRARAARSGLTIAEKTERNFKI